MVANQNKLSAIQWEPITDSWYLVAKSIFAEIFRDLSGLNIWDRIAHQLEFYWRYKKSAAQVHGKVIGFVNAVIKTAQPKDLIFNSEQICCQWAVNKEMLLEVVIPKASRVIHIGISIHKYKGSPSNYYRLYQVVVEKRGNSFGDILAVNSYSAIGGATFFDAKVICELASGGEALGYLMKSVSVPRKPKLLWSSAVSVVAKKIEHRIFTAEANNFRTNPNLKFNEEINLLSVNSKELQAKGQDVSYPKLGLRVEL